jgi:cell shape-determining protein MreD
MNRRRAWALLLAALFLQVGPLSFLRPADVLPPYATVVVALVALAFGHRVARPYAVVAGAVEDLLTGRALGLDVLLDLGLAAAVAFTTSRLDVERPWLAAAVVSLGVLGERLVAGLALAAFGAGGSDVVHQALFGALYALPLTLVARALFVRGESAAA